MRNQPEVRLQMFEMIETWKRSGLSQKVFCEQQSIRFHAFYYWYKRYRQHHCGSDNSNTGFVKLQIEKPAATGVVEIHFPGGIRLLFHEPVSSNYLKALIS